MQQESNKNLKKILREFGISYGLYDWMAFICTLNTKIHHFRWKF